MLACVVLALVSASCTTEVDYTLGSEFVPTKQNMELKRRLYRLGEMSEGDTKTECQLLETRLYKTDSIVSSNLGSGYFGVESSNIYGIRRAGFMSQIVFGATLGDKHSWGYRPIFDSMALVLYVTDFHGDTTKKYRFNVYEVISNDYLAKGLNPDGENDSTFYVNFDPSQYVSSEPIFTFEYPNSDKGIYVGDIEKPRSCYVRLDETPATREYVSRLMFTQNLNASDGYANDVDSLYVAGNEEAFKKAFKGVYIAPAEEIEGEGGAMFATNLKNSAMVLYARSRYEEDPTIIKDTAQMAYNLYVDPAERDMENGNVSINRVVHNFDNAKYATDLNEHNDVLVGYVDGMAGVITELWFTDEFIQSLADIVLSEKDAVVSVNQARLAVYLEGSDYDHTFDPLGMAEIMNSAMERVGMYAKYGAELFGITDYPYGLESSYSIEYGGYLNRSLAAYSMDISTHIESLMKAAAENVDEDGRVEFDKFEEDYEPKSESLVDYRRVYIGPEASACFGFDRQAIYGTDGEIDGVKNSAPITLDMTYTIVR